MSTTAERQLDTIKAMPRSERGPHMDKLLETLVAQGMTQKDAATEIGQALDIKPNSVVVSYYRRKREADVQSAARVQDDPVTAVTAADATWETAQTPAPTPEIAEAVALPVPNEVKPARKRRRANGEVGVDKAWEILNRAMDREVERRVEARIAALREALR